MLAAVLGAALVGAAWPVVVADVREGTAVLLAAADVALARATEVAGGATEPAWTADDVAVEEAALEDADDEAGPAQAVTARTTVIVVARNRERGITAFIGTMASFRCGPERRPHYTGEQSHHPATTAPP